jgi:soluble lytic murein transglycosylase-like protein
MDQAALENAARTAAAAVGIPAELFFGLIRTESNWNPGAQSGAGAVGLTQVMPWWLKTLGMTIDQLWDPVQNLTAGAKIFSDELNYFADPALAAMAYNAGRPAVLKAIAAAGGSRDPAVVSPFLPSAETRAYWQKVLTWADSYAGGTPAPIAALETTAADIQATVEDSPGITAGLILLIVGLGYMGMRR